MNYELEELENARFSTIFEEEADIKYNIDKINDKLQELINTINNKNK